MRSSRLRMILIVLLASGLTACETSERPRSLIDQFKIVSVRCEPPEVNVLLDRTIEVSALVADPEGGGEPLEYALIACTRYDGIVGCLEEIELVDEQDIESETLELDEEDYRYFFERFVKRGRIDSPGRAAEARATFEAPFNYLFLMEEYGYDDVDASLMMLVCKEGQCPMLDEIDAYLADAEGALTGEQLMLKISDPSWLTSGAPMESSALARKSYVVSERSRWDLNHNPELLAPVLVGCETALSSSDPAARTCDIEASVSSDSLETYYSSPESTVLSQEAVVLRFYTTAGEMSPHTAQIYASTEPMVSSTLMLPEEEAMPSHVDIFLVAVDTRGGMDFLALTDALR